MVHLAGSVLEEMSAELAFARPLLLVSKPDMAANLSADYAQSIRSGTTVKLEDLPEDYEPNHPDTLPFMHTLLLPLREYWQLFADTAGLFSTRSAALAQFARINPMHNDPIMRILANDVEYKNNVNNPTDAYTKGYGRQSVGNILAAVYEYKVSGFYRPKTLENGRVAAQVRGFFSQFLTPRARAINVMVNPRKFEPLRKWHWHDNIDGDVSYSAPVWSNNLLAHEAVGLRAVAQVTADGEAHMTALLKLMGPTSIHSAAHQGEVPKEQGMIISATYEAVSNIFDAAQIAVTARINGIILAYQLERLQIPIPIIGQGRRRALAFTGTPDTALVVAPIENPAEVAMLGLPPLPDFGDAPAPRSRRKTTAAAPPRPPADEPASSPLHSGSCTDVDDGEPPMDLNDQGSGKSSSYPSYFPLNMTPNTQTLQRARRLRCSRLAHIPAVVRRRLAVHPVLVRFNPAASDVAFRLTNIASSPNDEVASNNSDCIKDAEANFSSSRTRSRGQFIHDAHPTQCTHLPYIDSRLPAWPPAALVDVDHDMAHYVEKNPNLPVDPPLHPYYDQTAADSRLFSELHAAASRATELAAAKESLVEDVYDEIKNSFEADVEHFKKDDWTPYATCYMEVEPDDTFPFAERLLVLDKSSTFTRGGLYWLRGNNTWTLTPLTHRELLQRVADRFVMNGMVYPQEYTNIRRTLEAIMADSEPPTLVPTQPGSQRSQRSVGSPAPSQVRSSRAVTPQDTPPPQPSSSKRPADGPPSSAAPASKVPKQAKKARLQNERGHFMSTKGVATSAAAIFSPRDAAEEVQPSGLKLDKY
jgi:hypothetical protein